MPLHIIPGVRCSDGTSKNIHCAAFDQAALHETHLRASYKYLIGQASGSTRNRNGNEKTTDTAKECAELQLAHTKYSIEKASKTNRTKPGETILQQHHGLTLTASAFQSCQSQSTLSGPATTHCISTKRRSSWSASRIDALCTNKTYQATHACNCRSERKQQASATDKDRTSKLTQNAQREAN